MVVNFNITSDQKPSLEPLNNTRATQEQGTLVSQPAEKKTGGDVVKISPEGQGKLNMANAQEAEASSESGSPMDQLVKRIEKQIEQVKKEIQQLKQQSMEEEVKKELLAAKEEQLIQLQTQLAEVMSIKMQAEKSS